VGEAVAEGSIVLRYENRSRGAAKSGAQAAYVYSNAKEKHYLERVAFVKEMAETDEFAHNPEARVSFLLAMNNYRLVHENVHIKREVSELLKTEYERLSQEHDFLLPELPFCVVVPTLNNGQDFR
jgi:hypothetical protein